MVNGLYFLVKRNANKCSGCQTELLFFVGMNCAPYFLSKSLAVHNDHYVLDSHEVANPGHRIILHTSLYPNRCVSLGLAYRLSHDIICCGVKCVKFYFMIRTNI